MHNKRWATVLVALVVACSEGNPSKTDSGKTPCSDEGDFSDVKTYRVCCMGLVSVSTSEPLDAPDSDGGTCSTPFNLDPTRICTRCGNGQCGTGENRCNCPADCT
jgi:hypothetical protein